MMDMDAILAEIGDFGKYQKLVLWFILLPGVFPCGFHAYNQLFMAAVPNHWCKIPQLANVSEEAVKNFSIPSEYSDKGMKFSQCYMYDLDYSIAYERLLQANGSYANKNGTLIVPCKYGWIYDDSIYKRTTVTEWNLVCERDLFPTLALVLLGIGGLIGNYIFGYVQDRVGRKPAFFVYLLIQCAFGMATAFAHSFLVWTIFRIGVGFTVPAILGTPYVLAVELVGPRQRTLVTILINIAYSLALVCLSLIVYVIRDWRILALATTLPFFVLFAFWWLLPESPRWLLSQGRNQEAFEILTKIAKVNGKEIPEVLYKQQPTTNEKDANDVRSVYGILDLFRTPNLRTKTILITFIWFTNTSVYVGLSYYAPSLGGDEFLNFFLAGAVELPTYLFLWPALEKWGRRWSLCSSMVVGGASCLATFLVQNDSVVTLGLYCVGKMGISSAFVVLPLMASELYPTVVRGLGMSLSSVVSMLGPILIPLINYLGSEMLTLPLIIMGTMLIMGGTCSLLLPETLNQHLPESLDDAEEIVLGCYATSKDTSQKINATETSL